ncbi:MAG TPA: BadF/BadG/BcrA/BcrD ATPase family protein, partial [Anaerolineales bacterium]|nr:BadF/BadG/BcrA/BcrD ATPase family protein [Anaerolineales bacterium]
MAYAAGVDVGSTQTKAIIINEDREIVGRSLIDTGANVVAAAENAYDEALRNSDLQEEEVE